MLSKQRISLDLLSDISLVYSVIHELVDHKVQFFSSGHYSARYFFFFLGGGGENVTSVVGNSFNLLMAGVCVPILLQGRMVTADWQKKKKKKKFTSSQ